MTRSAMSCEVADVRSEVKALLYSMRNALEAGAYGRCYQLTNQMEVLTRSYLEPAIDPLPGVRLTRIEARLAGRLVQAKGKPVTKPQLMDAIYFDRAGDDPDVKIIDVFVCKLRRKLAGTRFSVETVWGMGYALKAVESDH